MYLCIDIGNTSIGFGIYQNTKQHYITSLYPERINDNFSYTSFIKEILEASNTQKEDIESIIYSSVVPKVDDILIPVLKNIFNKDVIRIKSLPLNIKIEGIDINEVGDDLICDLEGANYLYQSPTIVIDLGTASKVLLIDKNSKFDSCLIIPGLSMSIASLSMKAALLPTIDLKTPESVLAHNTIDAMNAGIILGHVEMIKGLCQRIEKEIGYQCKKVITGGSAKYLLKDLGEEYHYVQDLVNIGMIKMYEGL
jgi:type III pantothenate kinase